MLYGSLAEVDPEVHALIEKEKERQLCGLELIASEVGTSDHLAREGPSIITYDNRRITPP